MGGRGFARAHALHLPIPQWVRGKQDRGGEVSPTAFLPRGTASLRRYSLETPPGDTGKALPTRVAQRGEKSPTGPVDGRLLLLLVPHGGQEAPRETRRWAEPRPSQTSRTRRRLPSALDPQASGGAPRGAGSKGTQWRRSHHLGLGLPCLLVSPRRSSLPSKRFKAV